MNINNNYDIIKTPKLIDLNGDITKFDCHFKITSESPFYVSVLNQKMLDNGDIQFRPPEKQAGGTVKYERDEHLPHFLALKADKDCKVNVQIRTVPLEPPIKLQDYQPQQPQQPQQFQPGQSPVTPINYPPEVQQPPQQQIQPQDFQQYQQQYQQQYDYPEQKEQPKSKLNPYVLIAIVAGVFVVIYLITRKKEKPPKMSMNLNPIELSKPVRTEPELLLPSLTIPDVTPSLSSGSGSLIDKVKNFPIN